MYSVSKEKFFKIGNVWIVTMEGESVFKTYNHIAFQADATELPGLRQEIEALGLEILPGRSRRVRSSSINCGLLWTKMDFLSTF